MQLKTNRAARQPDAIKPAWLVLTSLLLASGWHGHCSLFFKAAYAKSNSAKASTTKSVPAPSAANPRLTEIEQRLFFREYTSEDDAVRLNRIEQQIFGENFAGSADERLAHIEAALPPIEKPQPAPPNATTVAPKEKQTYQTPQLELSDDSDAAEREKMAVMSAKQEEVLNLLSEGVRLWHAKQGAQAIEKFQQVIRLDPQNAQAYFSLGVAFESKGAFVEADQCYRSALGIDPNNKSYSDALKSIQKRVAAKQNLDAQQSQLRALADDAAKAYQAGEMLSALDLYKQLDDKSPRQALVKWNIGTIYLLLKNPYSALQYYKEASKLKPDEQRYTQAVTQLEQNLKRNELQQKQAEDAWSQTQGPQNVRPVPQTVRPVQTNPNFVAASPPPPRNPVNNQSKPPEPLLFYGVTVKTSKGGARITEIAPGSRGAQVGLRVGDFIKAVDGNVVTNSNEIDQILLGKPPGQRFQFTIQREKRLGAMLF